MTLKGATGMVQVSTEVQLTGVDAQDAVRAGLTALPNAAAEAVGGLFTRGAGAGQINQPANGQIDANTVKLSGTVQTAADIGALIDVAVSTRLATAGYTAPDNATITAINAKTTNLPIDPADQSLIIAATDAIMTRLGVPAGASVVADIATRLAAAGYTAPLDAAGTRAAVGLALANLDTQLAAIAGYIDTEVAAILAAVDTEIGLIKAKTDNLPAAPAAVGDIPTAVQNADALLGRNIAGGSSAGRLVKEALYVLRNKIAVAAGTLTVYGADDATPAFTAAVTTAAGDPVSGIDPV